MRMSDWSSDVCSSDLLVGRQIGPSLHLAHIIQQGPQFALMRMDIFGQTPAGIGEQHVMDESDAAGRALDIGEDGLDVGKMHHAAMVSYLGNVSAIGSPVKSAPQPSGETNSRIAVKDRKSNRLNSSR